MTNKSTATERIKEILESNTIDYIDWSKIFTMTEKEYDNLKFGDLIMHREGILERFCAKSKLHKIDKNGNKSWVDCVIYGRNNDIWVREKEDFMNSFTTYEKFKDNGGSVYYTDCINIPFAFINNYDKA